MIHMLRSQAGEYVTKDGRLIVRKVLSQQTRRAVEVVWQIVLDGKALARCFDTKRDALEYAERTATDRGRSLK